MYNNKKLITEATILDELRRGRISLPPLSFRLIEAGPIIDSSRLDALIEGRWDKSSALFAAEIKALSTPKAFIEGVALLKTAALPKKSLPLLVAPFLSEKQLQELERENINGVDLCGNGVFNIPGRLTVLRTGRENPFASYTPIKNVYRKNSSMVGRAFFAFPQFASVKQIIEEVGKRDVFAKAKAGSSLTVGTVSKVLAEMVQDLVIERSKNKINLLQPDTLLEKLSGNYPGVSGTALTPVKVNLEVTALIERLTVLSQKFNAPIMATGLSSVSRYAVMQREEMLSVYCSMGKDVLSELDIISTGRFPNLQIIDSMDATAYFDAREENGFYWASPIQTYLELMAGDKRDLDAAEQVKTFILGEIRKANL